MHRSLPSVRGTCSFALGLKRRHPKKAYLRSHQQDLHSMNSNDAGGALQVSNSRTAENSKLQLCNRASRQSGITVLSHWVSKDPPIRGVRSYVVIPRRHICAATNRTYTARTATTQAERYRFLTRELPRTASCNCATEPPVSQG